MRSVDRHRKLIITRIENRKRTGVIMPYSVIIYRLSPWSHIHEQNVAIDKSIRYRDRPTVGRKCDRRNSSIAGPEEDIRSESHLCGSYIRYAVDVYIV